MDGKEEDDNLCTYTVISSEDKLLVNVTPQAFSVVKHIIQVGFSA